MQMNARERVLRTVRRQTPDRTPYLRWDNLELSDFVAPWARKAENMTPVRKDWVDEWGCRWQTIDTTVGQVVSHPIKAAFDYSSFSVPKPVLDRANLEANREEYGDRVSVGGVGYFFFERLEKLRGFNDAMMDLLAERDRIDDLLNRLTAYYMELVDMYADSDLVDCIGVNEDLGLQERLTISPSMWREIFRPHYRTVYEHIHARGLLVFQHSCGYVQDIISDLAEIGVDILELQQLACMDMDVVTQNRGQMVITAPVDIQAVLPTGDWSRIKAFQEKLFKAFDSVEGGYIAQMYCDLPSLGVAKELDDRLQSLILDLCRWRGEGTMEGA